MTASNHSPRFGRRSFMHRAGVMGGATLLASWPLWARDQAKVLRFGVITDVHQDIMHDAGQRLSVFIETMRKEQVDFIVQLGDFCIPKAANQSFLDIWNTFPGPRYHVLGNHDTDGGYQRADTVAWWGMAARYYAFEQGGVKFIVLDGNDRPEDHAGGYPRYIAEDQLAWLEKELDATSSPVILFVHQSIEREEEGGVQNGAAVRQILEAANDRAGQRKVVACFSGHHHRDYVRQIRDIVYPQINSASYHWVGSKFKHVRYSEAIDRSHPNIKYTVPYKDPIFGLVTIDPHRGFMQIQGRQSSFVGPAPWEIGQDRAYWKADTLTAGVSDWKMPI